MPEQIERLRSALMWAWMALGVFAVAGAALVFLGTDSAVSAALAWVGLALMLVAGWKTTRALRG